MNSVGQLYDDLFLFEHKSNSKESRPIHKSLRFEDANVADLYQWILANFNFDSTRKMLDCGCGAGYGSVALAKALGVEVHGISISQKEIEQAKHFAQSEGVSGLCTFKKKSFEEIDSNYDLIIAIESLKHSEDLHKTMKVLSSHLNPNGTMLIIEDFYQIAEQSFSSRRLMNDWVLKSAFAQKDYTGIDGFKQEVRDFSSQMKHRSKLTIALRIAFAEIMVGLGKIGIGKTNAAKIFRGGFYLEWLYAKGAMKYQLLKMTKA